MKTKLSKANLNSALRILAESNNDAFVARQRSIDHCLIVYGTDPYVLEISEFLDTCDGGCGMNTGLTASEFETLMVKAQDYLK